MTNNYRSRKGNALLELAVIAPVAFLLLFGTMDFARVFALGNVVASAARCGAQYGIRSTSNAQAYSAMQTAALNDAGNPSGMTARASSYCTCSSGGAAIACNSTCSGGNPYMYVKVDVSSNFSTVVNYWLIPSSFTVSSSAIMRAQ